MTTPISRAIDALSDPTVRAPDALRTLLVVAMRVDDEGLVGWIRHELEGYTTEDEIPVYRQAESLPIEVTFNGYGGSQRTSTVSEHDLPDNLRPGPTMMREPVAELEELASGPSDPSSALPSVWLALYRDAISKGNAPGWERMFPNLARVIFPRTQLRGVVDRVKTNALTMAIGLESVSPEAGSAGGPTVRGNPELQAPINTFITNVYGEARTLTIGRDNAVAGGDHSVAVQLEAGDLAGLLASARGLITEEGVSALSSALSQDGGEPKSAVRGILTKVSAGSWAIAGGVTGNAAYDGLVELLKQVFPSFVG